MSKLPILLDTDIGSIFAEIGQFEQLLQLFQGHNLLVSTTVHQELTTGLQLRYNFLQAVLKYIGKGKVITIHPPIAQTELNHLPNWMGRGEGESIIICQQQGWIFASNDCKATNYCKRNSILCITLNDILAALWKGNIVTKPELQQIITEIEATNRKIRSKENILK